MANEKIAQSPQDEALAQAAEQALMNYEGVRVWTDALELTSTNSVVEIKGHVRTQAEKEVTEDVILKTKGVKDVVSDLYVDTDLEIMVAKALGDDPRTRGSFPGILVGSAFGDLYLKGNVASAEIKKAAEEIAGKVPGVLQVFNQLEIAAAVKPAATAAAPKPVVAKPVVAKAPAPAGDKPAAVKPPATVGGKPVVAVKPPATVGGKPVVARKPASGNITPVKPPTTVGGRPVVPVKRSAPKPEASADAGPTAESKPPEDKPAEE